jgi:hypothetical protein
MNLDTLKAQILEAEAVMVEYETVVEEQGGQSNLRPMNEFHGSRVRPPKPTFRKGNGLRQRQTTMTEGAESSRNLIGNSPGRVGPFLCL